VYRCLHAFVERLSDDFELSLVSLGRPLAQVDSTLFKGSVTAFELDNLRDIDVGLFDNNLYSLAFFTDVGMNPETVIASNFRIAPTQVCGYGHPVSTAVSEIDYWLGGKDIERAAAADALYDERLVLIRGGGIHPTRPRYQPNKRPRSRDLVRIGCAWSGRKINWPLL
jgi:hypothetical protein